MALTLDSFITRAKRKVTHIQNSPLLRRNAVLKDSHLGQPCFIVGNGPSIKTQDLARLRDEQTIATNSFFRHELFDVIRPKFYVVFDSEHFRGHEESLQFFRDLSARIHSETVLFFPLKARQFIESNGFVPNNQVYYIYAKGDWEEDRRINLDITKTVPGAMGVGVMCLVIAEYLGFDPIYLLGFDHNVLTQRVDQDMQHFYENSKFDRYEKKDTYELRCWSYYILFKSYRLLRDRVRGRIINLTPGSFLDIFPTDTYEQILGSKAVR